MRTEVEMKQKCDVLKRIASQYPDGSEELLALQRAATALQLVFLKDMGAELDQMVKNIDKPLSETQRDSLRNEGID